MCEPWRHAEHTHHPPQAQRAFPLFSAGRKAAPLPAASPRAVSGTSRPPNPYCRARPGPGPPLTGRERTAGPAGRPRPGAGSGEATPPSHRRHGNRPSPPRARVPLSFPPIPLYPPLDPPPQSPRPPSSLCLSAEGPRPPPRSAGAGTRTPLLPGNGGAAAAGRLPQGAVGPRGAAAQQRPPRRCCPCAAALGAAVGWGWGQPAAGHAGKCSPAAPAARWR